MRRHNVTKHGLREYNSYPSAGGNVRHVLHMNLLWARLSRETFPDQCTLAFCTACGRILYAGSYKSRCSITMYVLFTACKGNWMKEADNVWGCSTCGNDVTFM